MAAYSLCLVCDVRDVEYHKTSTNAKDHAFILRQLLPAAKLQTDNNALCRRCVMYLKEYATSKSEKAKRCLLRRIGSQSSQTETVSASAPKQKKALCHTKVLEEFAVLSTLERSEILKELPGDLSVEEKSTLCHSITQSENKDIRKDAAEISGECRRKSRLQQCTNGDRETCVNRRNPVILAFNMGLLGLPYPCTDSLSQVLIICLALEHLYQLAYQRFQAPNSFQFGLFLDNKTGSRKVVNMINKVLPSGSYKTITNFLRGQSFTKASIPNEGVIINTFYNEQVITYKKSINPNSSSKCSVITTRIASIFNVCRDNEQIRTKR